MVQQDFAYALAEHCTTGLAGKDYVTPLVL